MNTKIEHIYKLKTEMGRTNTMAVYVMYSKGGFNCFTYKQERRGWYLHMQPTEIRGNMRSFEAFSGYKMLITECNRNCKSAMEEAVAYMDNHKKEIAAKWFPQYDIDWEQEV